MENMSETPSFVTPQGRKIAYHLTDGTGPAVVFLGGFKSDMGGTKVTLIGRALLALTATGAPGAPDLDGVQIQLRKGDRIAPIAQPSDAVTYDSASPLSSARPCPGGSEVLAATRIAASRESVVGMLSVGTVS